MLQKRKKVLKCYRHLKGDIFAFFSWCLRFANTMIRKGQNFRFGFYDVAPEQRMRTIKDVGFDDTMLWWGKDFENTDGDRYFLHQLACKCGLQVHTVHFPSNDADFLWYGDERGKKIVSDMNDTLQDCEKLEISYVVLHLTKKLITPPPNQTGLDNLYLMLKTAERTGVTIAVENTRFMSYLDYVFGAIDHPLLKLCYDSGHNNAFMPGEDVLGKYGNKLVTTHIHDNYGRKVMKQGIHPDQHHMMGDGVIDFDEVFAQLKKYGCRYYNLESYCNPTSKYFNNTDMREYLQLSYDKLTAQLAKF